ncbi:MAG TPA: hypothetical protein VFK02_34380 [Kofleriaceae bacterium]|nr:hypothetical protein [Kofleriaceae bacterium]
MELTFYDVTGRPIAYCEDGRHVYAFTGLPLAYLDGDSVFAFDGQHLGWWDRGWVRDHHGAWVFFTEIAAGVGLALPARRGAPPKGIKNVPPPIASGRIKPVPFADGSGWSSRSGAQFFPSSPR